MRIWLIADSQQLNSQYRAFHPILNLSRRGHEVRLDVEPEQAPRTPEPGWDAVFVYRWASPELRRFLRAQRALGSAVVWDNDDDLTREQGRRHGAMVSQQLTRAYARSCSSPTP